MTFKIEREGCGWEFTLRDTVFLIDSYLIKGTSGEMRDDGVFSNTLENSRCLDIFLLQKHSVIFLFESCLCAFTLRAMVNKEKSTAINPL